MRIFELSVFVFLQITCIYASADLVSPLGCQAWDTQCVTAFVKRLSTPKFFDLNILKIDPYKIDHFKLEKDGLVFEIKDTLINGLNNMIVEDFRTDPNTSTVYMKIRTDVVVTGLYKASGSLLYMPINSEGDYWTSLKNLEISVEAPYKIVKSAFNNEPLLEATDYKMSNEVKEKAEFRLNDKHYGFPGANELLNQLINYNWKYLSSNYVSSFISNAMEKITKPHKSYFRLAPFELVIQ